MNKPNRFSLILTVSILLLSLVLSSCNVPTVTTSDSVELSTPTAPPVVVTEPPVAVASPTDLLPTNTPTADCDLAQFVTDVTYPDNASVDANTEIIKTWQVKNAGSCAWDNTYKLVFIRGEQMIGTSPADVITNPVAPNGTADLSIKLIVPEINGTHWGVWQLYNRAGKPVLKADGTPQEFSILINITNGHGGKVTSVRYWSYSFTGVKCTNNVQYDVATNIYADGPIGVGYTWSVTNGVLVVVSQNYVFSGAGNVEVKTTIAAPFADPKNVVVTLTANGVTSSFTICP
jgi:hypothetical protein